MYLFKILDWLLKEMVYKKYIKKNGKIYGPYNYQSKRVDGKVVSEYVGPETSKKRINKISLLVVSLAIISVVFVLLFIALEFNLFSGKVISEDFDNPQDNVITGASINQEPVVSETNSGEFEQTMRTYKDWIIVTFSLGDNEIEYSYNKDISETELISLIEKDKANWLNKISNTA